LDSHHTFSFADYYDPSHMGFSALRVINDDRVIAGGGFPKHSHQNMEIISYILDGALEHKDSMGNTSIIRRSDIQRMSAGRGVTHSEFNHSDSELVHFLQIWILPERNGLDPGYAQTSFADEEKLGRLRLIGSRDGRDGSVTIHQDVDLYATVLTDNHSVTYEVADGRLAWLHVARGAVTFNEQSLHAGDGVSVAEPGTLRLTGSPLAEVLLFDIGEGSTANT